MNYIKLYGELKGQYAVLDEERVSLGWHGANNKEWENHNSKENRIYKVILKLEEKMSKKYNVTFD